MSNPQPSDRLEPLAWKKLNSITFVKGPKKQLKGSVPENIN